MPAIYRPPGGGSRPPVKRVCHLRSDAVLSGKGLVSHRVNRVSRVDPARHVARSIPSASRPRPPSADLAFPFQSVDFSVAP